jgi:hypothetical protein
MNLMARCRRCVSYAVNGDPCVIIVGKDELAEATRLVAGSLVFPLLAGQWLDFRRELERLMAQGRKR